MLGTLFEKFNQGLDLLLPPRCVHCQAANSWLCETCVSTIPFIVEPVCEQCGTPIPASTPAQCQQCQNHPLQHIDGVRTAALFEDNPIRSAIHALKYRNLKAVAPVLGNVLANAYHQYHLTADVIVPVPLHRSRHKERGYNQSQLLAKQLGRLLDLPVNTITLQRIRKTRSQMKLGAQERHKNVAQAFACKNEQVQNLHILLIDDVCTTGSTLDSCAASLKQSNAASVWGLTLARAS